ncbi:zinc-binding dehydrogenase [Persicobacter diffluens]|uniref:Alcohol dehydrogenase n=1 Tax=Persicobacter diffluens TaxID=981 RepID=A0AAN4VZ87_9BACT|nr:alcohol dehydrogenase [Persicobacter diffluens]
MKALTFSDFGAADVLEYQEIPKPQPVTHEVLVEMKAIGLNYADIYRRRGNYHLKGSPPYIAGYEGAGVVIESKSQLYPVGSRVAFADVPFANAEYVVVPEHHIIPLQDHVPFELAASVLLQGLTAHYLCHDSYAVKAGDIALVHAAAGGVGQLLSQMVKLMGGTVIGLTRKEEKLALLEKIGIEYPLLLDANWKKKVSGISHNRGVDVVFDSVGSTLADSLSLSRTGGTTVFYGMSGGDPAPVDPRMLMDSSKKLVGGDLWNYLTSAFERKRRANQIFQWILNEQLVVNPPVKFSLAEGRAAHEYLESGQSAGKVLLIP